MPDTGSLRDLSVGAALLFALWLVLKYKPWERSSSANDERKINGFLVQIAKYAESLGELKRDIHELHIMFFGLDGHGGFAKEIDRLRAWREEVEIEHREMQQKINRLENRQKDRHN